jgi:hypothetical protein
VHSKLLLRRAKMDFAVRNPTLTRLETVLVLGLEIL